MKILRRVISRDGARFAILRFMTPEPHEVSDAEIAETAKDLGLRFAKEEDVSLARLKEWSIGRAIVIYGLERRGSEKSGGFLGYDYLTPSGALDRCEHWTRERGTWSTDCEFLFLVDAQNPKTP